MTWYHFLIYKHGNGTCYIFLMGHLTFEALYICGLIYFQMTRGMVVNLNLGNYTRNLKLQVGPVDCFQGKNRLLLKADNGKG